MVFLSLVRTFALSVIVLEGCLADYSPYLTGNGQDVPDAGHDPRDVATEPLDVARDAGRTDLLTDSPHADNGASPCPAGEMRCGGACVDVRVNDAHCGACGGACMSGLRCVDGGCSGSCPAPQVVCDRTCVNLLADARHCGNCNEPCSAGQGCFGGVCRIIAPCMAPMTLCSGSCINTASDNAHCGGCDVRCGATQLCTSGACVPPGAGMAGRACSRDADCGAGGACLPPGQGFSGGYCIYGCAAGARAGDSCVGGSGVCVPMDAGSLNCLPNCDPRSTGQCRTGYICQNISTGGSIGVCYPQCTVNPGAICGAYRCNTTTGECSRAACTTSTQCSSGSVCNAGVCECTAATNCGAGNRCYPRAATTSAYCACATNASCASGEMCDTSTGRCL